MNRDQDHAKHQAARRWVSAVNNWGQLGRWTSHMCKDPQMLGRELEWLKHQAMSGKIPVPKCPIGRER
jgi:type III restriction enzyme